MAGSSPRIWIFFRNFAGKLGFSGIEKHFGGVALHHSYFFHNGFSVPNFRTVPFFEMEAPIEDAFREEMYRESAERLNEMLKEKRPEFVILEPPHLNWYLESARINRKLLVFTKRILRIFDFPVHLMNVTVKSKWYYQERLGTSPFESIDGLKKLLGRNVSVCFDPVAALNSVKYNYPVLIKTLGKKIASAVVVNAEISAVNGSWIYQRVENFGKGSIPWNHVITLIKRYCGEGVTYLIEAENLRSALRTKRLWVKIYDSVPSDPCVSEN